MKTSLFIIFLLIPCIAQEWRVPVAVSNRESIEEIRLTAIGAFGVMRKARPGIPAHHHTGVDIVRPDSSYENQPIFAAAPGMVISMRDDGPYAQIIVKHPKDSGFIWTVYEHVSGIDVKPGDSVTTDTRIARYFNKGELDKYGWQFDHVHFEVMKSPPMDFQPTAKLPHRHFRTYALACLTKKQLDKNMEHPLEFLKKQFESAR